MPQCRVCSHATLAQSTPRSDQGVRPLQYARGVLQNQLRSFDNHNSQVVGLMSCFPSHGRRQLKRDVLPISRKSSLRITLFMSSPGVSNAGQPHFNSLTGAPAFLNLSTLEPTIMLSLPALQPLETEWERIISLRELLESKYVST